MWVYVALLRYPEQNHSPHLPLSQTNKWQTSHTGKLCQPAIAECYNYTPSFFYKQRLYKQQGFKNLQIKQSEL